MLILSLLIFWVLHADYSVRGAYKIFFYTLLDEVRPPVGYVLRDARMGILFWSDFVKSLFSAAMRITYLRRLIGKALF